MDILPETFADFLCLHLVDFSVVFSLTYFDFFSEIKFFNIREIKNCIFTNNDILLFGFYFVWNYAMVGIVYRFNFFE